MYTFLEVLQIANKGPGDLFEMEVEEESGVSYFVRTNLGGSHNMTIIRRSSLFLREESYKNRHNKNMFFGQLLKYFLCIEEHEAENTSVSIRT